MSVIATASIFYALTLAQSVAVALFVTPVLGNFSLALVMFTPLVSVLLMHLVVTRDGWTRAGWSGLGLGRLGLRQWPIAVGLPFLILLIAYGIVWTLGIAQVDGSGSGLPNPADLLLNLVVTLIFCFGEEIGWRGYLLPRLMDLGHRKALLLSGLMQAIWHVPFIVFTAFYHGGANPMIVVPLFLMTMTIAGILFGYLRLTSGSVWPAVIAHAVFNVFWTMFNALTIATSPLAYEYLAGESGILTLTIVAISAWLLLRRMEHRQTPRVAAVWAVE